MRQYVETHQLNLKLIRLKEERVHRLKQMLNFKQNYFLLVFRSNCKNNKL